MPDYSPINTVFQFQDNGVTIAADDTFTLDAMPFAGKVTACSYIPDAASTGDNTNYRTYSLINKGAAGAGTAVMATLALTTGVNLVAFDEKTIPLTATAADLVFASGDVLAWLSDATASGLVDPGGTVKVTVQRVQS